MIEHFLEEKQKLLNELKNLKNNVSKIENNYELDLEEIRTKVIESIENLSREKFSIALFGAFSDGKSTIVSAITKRTDIKISPDPSTDGIAEYKFGDWFIVDTPGLFSEKLMHDVRTKKYISEANVVIFTLDPVNPIKESHHLTTKWLLSDLDKMSSTIFVLNKMDEVADLEDDEDYERNCNIKVEVVQDTLKQIMGIKRKPKVLCVAADPFGQGLGYWFNDLEKYEKLSRIDNLRNEITQYIKAAKDKLIICAGYSVIKDSKNIEIEKLSELQKELKEQIEVLENQIEENTAKTSTFEKDINRNYSNINEEILNLRKDILQSIETSSDVSKLKSLIDIELGTDGHVINKRIDMIIERYTQNLYKDQKNFLKDMENSLLFYKGIEEKMIKSFATAGAKFGKMIMEKSSRELGNFVLKIRDISKLPVKFKPWGAIKWANRIKVFGKFMKALPLIIEPLTIVFNIYSEKKFKGEKRKITEEIQHLFKVFLETFTMEEYRKTYFPSFFELKETESNLLESKNNYHAILRKLNNSIYELENINL